MSGVPSGVPHGVQDAALVPQTSGVYFVRVLFGPDHLDSARSGQTKRELRTSLRTKDPHVARTLASFINARLAQCADMTNRQALWPDISHTISTWTLPGGISCNGEEDRRSLTQFLRDHPGLERALAKHIERSSTQLATASAIAPLWPQTPGTQQAAPAGAHAVSSVVPPAAHLAVPFPPAHLPLAPTRMSEAIKKFADRQLDTGVNNPRTLRDKEYLLTDLADYMFRVQPTVGEDCFLHVVNARHLNDFISEQARLPAKARGKGSIKNRPVLPTTAVSEGRAGSASKKRVTLSPLTLTKKISDLRTFFCLRACRAQSRRRRSCGRADLPRPGLQKEGHKERGALPAFHQHATGGDLRAKTLPRGIARSGPFLGTDRGHLPRSTPRRDCQPHHGGDRV